MKKRGVEIDPASLLVVAHGKIILVERPERDLTPNQARKRAYELLQAAHEAETDNDEPIWYAAGGDVARQGPYSTQQAAWDSLRLFKPDSHSSPYIAGARVWPEWDHRKTK